MSVVVRYKLDELDLDSLVDAGYTTLKLYAATSPDGAYSDTSVTPSPATLADAVTALTPYAFSFTYSAGNSAMWFKVLAYGATPGNSPLADARPFHGGGGTTHTVLRQRIGKISNSLYTSTTTSAGNVGGTTVVTTDPELTRRRDDFFGGYTDVDGWFLYIPSLSAFREITDWGVSAGTGTFTVSPAFSAQVGSGVAFEVINRWTPNEFRDAINWAVSESFPALSVPIIDTSTQIAEDTFQYDIPSDIKILTSVEIEDDSQLYDDESPSRNPWRMVAYQPIQDGLNNKIEFKRDLWKRYSEVNRYLRFKGVGILSQVYNESDYVEAIDPQLDILIYLAAHRLFQILLNVDTSTDVKRWLDRSNYFMALADQAKKQKAGRRPPKTMWQHDPRWT